MDGLRRLLKYVESPEFAARSNIANNLDTLLTTFAQDSVVQDLIEAVGKGTCGETVFERIVDLSVGHAIDSRYENPWDVAVSTYLFVMFQSLTHPHRVGTAIAATMAKRLENAWWAPQVADYVLGAMTVRPTATTDSSDFLEDIDQDVAAQSSESPVFNWIAVASYLELAPEMKSGASDSSQVVTTNGASTVSLSQGAT